MALVLNSIESRVSKAVAHYWATLDEQSQKQQARDADRGRRAAVTGGKQMDGFCEIIRLLLEENGVPGTSIYTDRHLEIPGFFRPTKRWDLIVVYREHLLAAMEFKSQRGPSFGNNFNNRAEEAIGVANDLWTAYREGAFRSADRPWLGWVMLLEDCPKSRQPVGVEEPHFPVFPDFQNTSYAKRYELLLRRLVLEKLYDPAALLTTTAEDGLQGNYAEPASDLTMHRLLARMAAHVSGLMADLA